MKESVAQIASAALLAGSLAAPAAAAECISPAGGWDFACRTIAKIMHEIGIVDEPMQVTSMAGDSGLVHVYVAGERSSDDGLIVATSTEYAIGLALDSHAGASADQVRFLGAIAADPSVIAVAAASPHQSLNDLLGAVIEDPDAHPLAGGTVAGGYDHLKALKALRRRGFEDIERVRYVDAGSAADAISRTVDGTASAAIVDISAVAAAVRSRDLRLLAVLAEQRVEGFEDVPTAQEQGIDLVAANWLGMYAPAGASEDSSRSWAEALGRIGDSPEWREVMAANGLVPFNKVGAAFQEYVDGLIAEVGELSRQLDL